VPLHDRTLILELSRSDALAEAQDWVNASSYLLAKAGDLYGQITTTIGVDPDTGEFRPGTLSLWVDNTDRAFDTRNGASPFAECLQARRQIRLRSHPGRPGEIVEDFYSDIYDDTYEGVGRAVSDADITTHFCGFINRWPRSYGMANQFSWVQLTATDGSLILQQSSVSDAFFTLDDDTFGVLDGEGLLATSEDPSVDNADPATHRLSGELVRLVLDAGDWPQNLRDIPPGRIVVGEGNAEGSSLQSLSDAAAAEEGYVLFWPDGRCAFLDRLYEWTSPRSAEVQARFGVDELPIIDIDGVGPDDNQIATNWRRTGLSGVEQALQDDEARRRWGRITDGPKSLTAVNDVDIVSQLEYRRARHGVRTEQITTLTLSGLLTDPATGETLHGVLVGLLPFDRIAVHFTPPGGDPYPPFEALVLQLATTISATEWTTVARLGPAPGEVLFALDDSLLDDASVLAP
jgi:hypothetical protein